MTDSRMLAMHEDLEAVRRFDEDLPTFDHKLFGSKNNAGYNAELNAALRGVHDAICDLNYELWSTKYALIEETKEGDGMTVPDNAYELAMELQSLTYDMSMLENLRRCTSELRFNIELHVDDGVYADGDNAGRMATTIEALKKLEDRCDDAIISLSKREQEVVWELSGKTTGIPDPFECPFCGSGAVLSEYSFACDSEAYVGVKCTRCEDVSGPDVQAVEFFGMSNPWRPSKKEGVKDTLKEATIEAVKLWNRRVYGGRPKVPVLMRAWSKCTNWSNEGIEAKPCPLCGGDPEIILNIGYYKDVWDAQMICRDCSMTGPRTYGLDDAWRLDPDALAADHPTLEQVRAEHPGITILESRKAAYTESINAWNHRACGREVSE